MGIPHAFFAMERLLHLTPQNKLVVIVLQTSPMLQL